jgi:hypothetical protein
VVSSATLGLALARGVDGEASLVWVGRGRYRPGEPVRSSSRLVTASVAARVALLAWLDLRVGSRTSRTATTRGRGYPAHGASRLEACYGKAIKEGVMMRELSIPHALVAAAVSAGSHRRQILACIR